MQYKIRMCYFQVKNILTFPGVSDMVVLRKDVHNWLQHFLM